MRALLFNHQTTISLTFDENKTIQSVLFVEVSLFLDRTAFKTRIHTNIKDMQNPDNLCFEQK